MSVVTRWLPRTCESCCIKRSVVMPNALNSSAAALPGRCKMPRNTCSTLIYSSCICLACCSAAFKARSRSPEIYTLSGSRPEPVTRGKASTFCRADCAKALGSVPSLVSSCGISPSCCCASAASRCSCSTALLEYSTARRCALCRASKVFWVNWFMFIKRTSFTCRYGKLLRYIEKLFCN